MTHTKRTVTATEKINEDKFLHVSRLETEQGDYIDIREYIPSLDHYGRGITVPILMINTLVDGIEAI